MNQAVSVLVVDDDDQIRAALRRFLIRMGCDVTCGSSVQEGRDALRKNTVDLAFVDYMLPDGNGAELIRHALSDSKAQEAYCMTGTGTPPNVVNAMRAGSTDVLEKPLDLDRVEAIVRAIQTARESLGEWRTDVAAGLVGSDPRFLSALETVRDVADTDCAVLIMGETGTGKELFASAVHKGSRRRERPFVALNCAAIPESLIEAELFGHTRGAFTGATVAREGRLAAAEGGTLFLDEIGDMPLPAQAKLLRVLQEHMVTPLGSDRPVSINVRIVAATNRPLEDMVAAGTFRADLFFRLSVIQVELPALRDRPEDIVPLARFFLAQATRRAGRVIGDLDETAEKSLQDYNWPGNIRELANALERAVLLKKHGSLSSADLKLGLSSRRSGSMGVAFGQPAPMLQQPANAVSSNMNAASPSSSSPSSLSSPSLPQSATLDPNVTHAVMNDGLNLRTALDAVERKLIEQALERTGGNRTEAAALLGLNRTTLVEKMRKLGG